MADSYPIVIRWFTAPVMVNTMMVPRRGFSRGIHGEGIHMFLRAGMRSRKKRVFVF